MSLPLRAVVFDNDETTGSYGLLFAITQVLEQLNILDLQILQGIYQRLGNWMIVHNVFRPGLRALLRCCLALRKQKRIDAILMYTNQIDTHTNLSVPRVISYMMTVLAGEQVFDHILARPNHPDQDGVYRKQFYRILELYPNVPKDIREITFLDDNAVPDFICHAGIQKSATSEKSWLKVEPYTRILGSKEIYECVVYCFQPVFCDDLQILIDTVFQYYLQFVPEKSCIPSAKPFMDITLELQRRYGYVPRAFMRDAITGLNSVSSLSKRDKNE